MSNNLHVEIIGQGPPLVLIHGWGWHSGIWRSLLPNLTQDFQIFCVDLPGFGKSPVLPINYDFIDIASRIFQSIPPRAIWLGWSLGGMLAWWVALHYPERISKLITVAASPRFVSDSAWPGVPTLTLNKFADSILTNYAKTLEDFLELQLRGSEFSKELLTELKIQLFTYPPPTQVALLGGLKLLQEIDLRKNISTINIPSLHIFGSLDKLVPVKMTAQLQILSPQSQIVIIEKASHMPFLTHQSQFVEIIKNNFL